MSFHEIQPILIILSIVLFCFLFSKTKEYYKNKKVKELFAWIISENSADFRCNLHLHNYIANAQNKCNLLQEHRVTSDEEWNTVKEILIEFQKDATIKYFTDNYHIPKSRYVINGEVYFIYLLNSYLESHQCEDKVAGHKMHSKTLNYKDYGSWGAPLFDATYELSDFGIIYHKLYYISYMFCKNNPVLNAKGELWTVEESIEEIIKSKQISISRL